MCVCLSVIVVVVKKRAISSEKERKKESDRGSKISIKRVKPVQQLIRSDFNLILL